MARGERPWADGRGDLLVETFADAYDEDHTAGEWVAAMVPRRVLPLSPGACLATGVLGGARPRLLADFLLSFADRLRDAEEAALTAFAAATLAMISHCLASDARRLTGDDHGAPAVLRERADRAIRDNLASARRGAARRGSASSSTCRARASTGCSGRRAASRATFWGCA